MSSTLTPSVRSLLRDHIDSVGAVELLMLLQSDPGRTWAIEDVCAALKCPPGWPAIELQLLSAAGLVEEAGGVWRFGPDDQARIDAVSALAAAYRTDPRAVVRFIFAKPRTAI